MFEITHQRVSAEADDLGQPQLIQPSDWNAALLATMATARFLGRLTAGAGAVEELTAAQLLSGIGAEAAGVAAALIAAHEIGDTHAMYLTAAEAGLLYAALIHAHAIADITGLQAALDAKALASRAISTTAPLTGGGDLSADRTLAISDFVASGLLHARGAVPDPGLVPGTSRFLREDATWASPGASATDIKTTEIDFGATPVNYGVFAIADADVSATSNIGIWLSQEAPTGRDADEAEMEPMDCKAADMATGTFNAVLQPFHGPVEGKYKLNYLVG